jgi:hypothetical protein
VSEQRIDELRPLVTELLERRGIGRVAGLGLLPTREAALGEQQLAQLHRRVEFRSSRPTTAAARHRAARPLDEPDVDRAQHLAVDGDTDVLHAGEHPHERVLDVAVEPGHALRLERRGERAGDVVHRKCFTRRQLGHLHRVPVEIELAGGRAAAAR